MIKANSQKKFCAVCYKDTTTFNDLFWYMNWLHGVNVEQITPDDFITKGFSSEYHYINLVTHQDERYQVTDFMEKNSVDRFTFIADDRTINVDLIGFGCFVYPGVTIYPSAIIEDDVMIHGNTGIAHNVIIRQGCFVSGGCVITGGSELGKHCWLATFTVVSGPV
jgi:acetyltransferase-like isoleucine patch superfamily enzyme